MPRSRPILIGDPRQLSAYNPLRRQDAWATQWAAGTVLEGIVHHRLWPVFNLVGVFRCPLEVTTLLSSAFYDNKLISKYMGTPIQLEAMPSKGYPIATLPRLPAETGTQRDLLNEPRRICHRRDHRSSASHEQRSEARKGRRRLPLRSTGRPHPS